MRAMQAGAKRRGPTALLALLALQGFCVAALADGLEHSPRPRANPVYDQAVGVAAPVAEQIVITRPKLRPAALEQKVLTARATFAAPKGGIDLASLRPKVRAEEAAAPAATSKKKRAQAPVSAKGSVCGVAAIKGEPIAPITSKVQGCGLADGVRVTSVSGVRLSIPATIDCATAKALNAWVEAAVQPAYDHRVVELKVAGHYVCRPRNNKKGAKVSEHGRGKAIDISGFVLDSGRTHMVLKGFDQTMRRAYKGACGIFGTTLGPGSDGYQDHLHLDTAANRNGAYCR